MADCRSDRLLTGALSSMSVVSPPTVMLTVPVPTFSAREAYPAEMSFW